MGFSLWICLDEKKHNHTFNPMNRGKIHHGITAYKFSSGCCRCLSKNLSIPSMCAEGGGRVDWEICDETYRRPKKGSRFNVSLVVRIVQGTLANVHGAGAGSLDDKNWPTLSCVSGQRRKNIHGPKGGSEMW